ncbi:hypothetical protein AGMMS49525_04540 [Bacteroidia bacterium]|nr:hypothetical protein AGMMS49525_04540 [Bacteroidia bacterium]
MKQKRKQQATPKKELNRQLTAGGFKRVPLVPFLWLQADGTTYNTDTQRESKPRFIFIQADGQKWKTEKVVLWLFAGIKPRKGKIHYKDGNAANKTVENMQYISTAQMQPEKVNIENLRTALRCFFELRRNEKPVPQNFETRLKLRMIVDNFISTYKYRNEKYYPVFEKWLHKDFECLQRNETATPAEIQRYTARERQMIIANYINRITAEICEGLQVGTLELKPYQKTKRELYNEKIQLCKQLGIKRKQQKPLRFPPEIEKDFAVLGIEKAEKPDFSKVEKLPTGAKLCIWLHRCIDILQAVEIAYPEISDGAKELQKKIETVIENTNFFE